MVDNDRFYNVKNRSSSVVVYNIPEDGIRREFAPGETKRVKFGELEKLSYQAGGRVLISSYLQVTDEQVQDALNIQTEPEYKLSEEQIIRLLKEGSLDEFLDCLDFAPAGVLDLVKDLSTRVPLTDYDKRKALLEKTGFDVDKAIAHIEQDNADEPGAFQEIQKQRRVQPKVDAPQRRTSGKYTVISENK